MSIRPRESTDYIVVHNAATSPSMDIGVDEIRRWHRAKGWLDVGYHFVIRRDGAVESGRSQEVPGAHVYGYNSRSVGICMAGGIAETVVRGKVKAHPDRPEANFTNDQYKALAALTKYLRGHYPDARVVGHCTLDPKKKPHCPGFPLDPFFAAYGLEDLVSSN